MKLIQLTGNDAYAIDQGSLVVGSSLVYDAQLTTCFNLTAFDPASEYLSEEVAQRLRRSAAHSTEAPDLDFTNAPNKLITVAGTVVPFNLIHPYNYFHFLIEALPSLLNLITSRLLAEDHVIVSGMLHPNMVQALKWVTRNKFPLMELHLLTAVQSARVIVAKGSYSANELISGNMVQDFHFNSTHLLALRHYFEQFTPPATALPGRKIFILRQSGQRNIVNLRQIVGAAKARGYDIVDTELLSFKQQIDLFSSASTIIGPTGAWLANLLFVREDVEVKVLYPVTCKTDTSIWMQLAGIFGVRVTDYYFDDIVLNSYQPIHSDFTVDLASFDAMLEG